MDNLNQVVSKLTPLVKAYARNMKILIVEDQSSNLDFYKVLWKVL
ncbi:hypothetical protein [Candidatus Sulfurimonas baltica]|nr:hypothetical protein [Candidatus Sulfurimonas baltica]